MKLPDAFNKFIQKSPQKEEVYLSLVLEAAAIGAAVWTLVQGKNPHIGTAATEQVEADSWEKRLEACDRAIARLAEKVGRDDFEKVVLGLPAYYLTPDDNIEHGTQGHIKTITEELELTAIGFVPIHQAIVHMIKQEEGVPPSVILLEIGPDKTVMILYRVGTVVGRASIASDDLVPELERALKAFKEIEVLPSRILLYGSVQETLEGYKSDLLKHPWPTRANFLHYPKIEILPQLALAGAVSLAGASELATQVGEEVATPVIQEATSEEERKGESVEPEERVVEPEENVVEVTPETLGFRRDVDILEHPAADVEKEIGEAKEVEDREKKGKGEEMRETLMRFISGVKMPRLQSVALPKTGFLFVLIVVLLIGGGGWLTYWVLPKATITVFQVPKTISEVSEVTVNPTATVVDAATKTVPGRKEEKTVSGEKTIAVTGQKDIGDPSRGTVTIYNKTLIGKQLKKGTILTAGSLSFTLDSEVSIASASESVGSITFGKVNAGLTAVKLGPQSNLPGSTEFSVKDTSMSIMIARNDAALSGGTSKVVTVVSRADYDSLVSDLTKDLIAKAKSELATGVSGGGRLIDETVKTTVTQKKFDAELDQEAKELHGSITISISGISFRDEDIASLFTDLIAANIPSGYTLRSSGQRVNATNVKLQKDGSINLTAQYQGQALPVFDLPSIRSKLAGISLTQAPEELKAIVGVGGVEIGKVTRSLWSKNLPVMPGNISISVAVLE